MDGIHQWLFVVYFIYILLVLHLIYGESWNIFEEEEWYIQLFLVLLLTGGPYIIPSACVFAFHFLKGDYASWFLQVMGIVLALLLLALLWFMYLRQRRKISSEWPSIVRNPPSDLPAAAVAALIHRDQDLLVKATVLDMLQNHTLDLRANKRLSAEAEEELEKINRIRESLDYGSRYPIPYHFRLVVQPGHKNEWEQILIKAVPREYLPAREYLPGGSSWPGWSPDRSLWSRFSDDSRLLAQMRLELNKYLQKRGLYDLNPSSWVQNIWTAQLAILGSILMGIGLVVWITQMWLVWSVGLVVIGAAYAAAAWIAHRWTSELNAISDAGALEVRQWQSFGIYLRSPAFDKARKEDPDGTDRLLPYGAAFNHLGPWREHPVSSLTWVDETDSGSYGESATRKSFPLDDFI